MADYRGLPGAFVFAFRRSDSLVFRAYAVTSAVVGAFVAVVLLLGLVSWLASPATPFGQQALLAVIGVLLLLPLFAPVLVVARRHRHDVGGRRPDALVGLAGFGVVLAVYLALLVSDPNPHEVSGPLGPAVAALDALPRSAWVVPPLLAVGLLALAVRLTRPNGSTADGGRADAPDEPSTAEDGAER